MTISKQIYQKMINLYPVDFQKQHGDELQQTFADMVEDFGVMKTWQRVLPDLLLSAPVENIKYFTVHSPIQILVATSGLLFVAPFMLFFIVAGVANTFDTKMDDIVSQQLDAHILAAKFLLFILPFVAFVTNFLITGIGAIKLKSQKDIFNGTFLRNNILSIAVLCISAACLAILYGHDLVPCLVHNFNSHNLKSIIETCKNA